MTIEHERLNGTDADAWRTWGPYLSERQWGTVREDYSPKGTAWEYLSHDASRSRAYRWGEDGIAGISDDMQRLCFAVAMWNGQDSILKERLFGLTGNEGNHGEDVKEAYYYLDATPTGSYLKMLYKYPQTEFPYDELLNRNKIDRKQPEVELIDLGAFDDDRYFDIFVEYAKHTVDDILIRITAINRYSQAARLDLLPQLWFRNTWSWGRSHCGKPQLSLNNTGQVQATHPELGSYFLVSDQPGETIFCENETNLRRIFSQQANGYFKDAFHDYVVGGKTDAINPDSTGTKCGIRFSSEIPAGKSQNFQLRLSCKLQYEPFENFDALFAERKKEADEFYGQLQKDMDDEDKCHVHRQALAGMVWTKQFYYFDVQQWLEGDPSQPRPPESRKEGRNHEWTHLKNAHIISMPDKWEYPWYAAWDLAFHCIPFALIDPEFAKQQLLLMTRESYMHANGQIPAYEWAFGDVNPPVHAWATWRVYQMDRKRSGKADRDFLERVFHKLLLNFTWWVNRKDEDNRNVFQGGFLGLDNIGVFDRSKPLPGGGHIDQADGTSWMAMYSLNMMRIAIELALENSVYQDIAIKFFEHFLAIADAMTDIAKTGSGLWDEEDKFYYDVLHLPDGQVIPMKVRSLVGLSPLFAVEVLEPETLERLPRFNERLNWILENQPELASLVSRWHEPGRGERRLLSLLRGHRMKCLLRRMLDESEFLSPYGIRALSKAHETEPYRLVCDQDRPIDCGDASVVDYQPAESTTNMFGGNSNWRGPIWMPMNYLLIESLQKFHHYYGDDFR
ncbi:MAG: glucosidase, partial [Planctomycetota bacterium]